jgi:magnesium transporter
VIDFDQNDVSEFRYDTVKEILKFKETETTTWINIDGIHDRQVMQEIADGFAIDRVILDDVMNTGLRPVLIEHDNAVFISLKMLNPQQSEEGIAYEQLSLILTPRVLLSFQERKGDFFEPVRNRIRQKKKRIVEAGPDYLAFALMDVVIDNYIMVLSDFGENIETLDEDEPETRMERDVLDTIFRYKKEVSFLAKNMKPARELILAFAKSDSDLLAPDTFFHLSELKNNISHVTEMLENYREVLTDQLNIYHTAASSRLNDKMKFLTIFSVIFIPLTFLAGIYGTNFDYLPELHFKYSYFIMWGVMVVLAVLMLVFFKRKKWF